nr:EAL domain-containing protein [uncultured Brevundimonas sp.]
MFNVIDCVWNQHDLRLVALAAAIWLVGGLAFFLLLSRAGDSGPARRDQWVAVAATAGGVGVWSTHFVAMLAYDGGMPMSFGPSLTVLSVAAAVGMFWIALRVFMAQPSPAGRLGAGVLFSLGVAAMHFTGMAAVQASARLHYDLEQIAVAALLGAVLVSAAFHVFARLRGPARIGVPALLSLLGVCLMHFIGMSATTLIPDPTMAGPQGEFSRVWLIGAIVVASTLLILLTAAAAFVERCLTDLRGLTEASLEGLMIVRDGRILEVNARFAALSGRKPAMLLGQSADTVLSAPSPEGLASIGSAPIEAALLMPEAEPRAVEVCAHTVEYRGRECRVLAVRDLTEKKEAQRQIEHLARHDALTDLPNRALLEERLEHAVAWSRRTRDPVAVLALDLDRFKAVNDIFGHAEGDRVLCRVADILRSCTRAVDTVARIGGDEFVIVQVGAAQPEGAKILADRILSTFAAEMDVTRDPTAVGVSIGVAVYPDDAGDPDTLRHGADVALYRAKQAGRGTARFFDQQMDAEVRNRRNLEHDLRHAILRRQLHVAYQPLVSTTGGAIAGYEALLRWKHPVMGEISPEVFIPIAEDTGSIVALGEWVLREACRTAATWPIAYAVSVNVSTVQFQVATLPDLVATVLAETDLHPSRLELEITESVLMKDRASALHTLNRLKALGVRIVMDDFGTGYSSLSNLQSFPFDKIKIDRSFIGAIEDDEAARSIIRAIVGLGRGLNLPVVAEGVETEAQRRMVADEGCPQAQGFLFGRPGSAPVFPERSEAQAA